MKTLIIAEVGLNHDGSFAMALSYIDACQAAGANIVKFQLHTEAEGTDAEPFRYRTPADRTRPGYWKRTGFTAEQWEQLRIACEVEGVGFMTSTFCEAAVHMARGFGQRIWKVPSGQVTNTAMLKAIAQQFEPVYLSTGLGTDSELERAVWHFHDRPVMLMHCVSIYPTPPSAWQHGMLERLARTYGLPVGLSDHSGGIIGPLAAAARFPLAAIEVHVTLSRSLLTPDVGVSVTMESLATLVNGVRDIEESRHAVPVPDASWRQARQMYMPTLVAKTLIPKGTLIQFPHLIYRKIGDGPGLPWESIVGRIAARDIHEGEGFTEVDFEAQCAPSAS